MIDCSSFFGFFCLFRCTSMDSKSQFLFSCTMTYYKSLFLYRCTRLNYKSFVFVWMYKVELQKLVSVQVYNDGLRNMNLLYILHKLAIPAVCLLGMVLAVPYAIARTIVPVLGQCHPQPDGA